MTTTAHRLCRPLAAAALLAIGPTEAPCALLCEPIEAEAVVFAAAEHEHRPRYFDTYVVRERDGVYSILAVKRARADFRRAVAVMNALERHAEFLPGYKWICVKRSADGTVHTALGFKPALLVPESRFTNQVEVVESEASYRQCWHQLPADSPHAMQAFRDEPVVNEGYWRVDAIDKEMIELSYFSSIKPPGTLASLVYGLAAQGVHQDLFEHVLARFAAPESAATAAISSPCAHMK
jgi:hypothetical protein